MDNLSEKNILDFLIKKFKGIMDLSPFYVKINELIEEEYSKGLEHSEEELPTNINFIPKEKDLNFLQEYVTDNIQKHSDDVAENLRQEIQRGIMNGDNTQQLVERIKLIFKEKKYMDRLKTVIRTESLRANNQGRLEGANQAAETGLHLKKWVSITNDKLTSKICHAEDSKYGEPSKAIPLDADFVVKSANKTIKSKIPPFHVNCRRKYDIH